MVAFFEVSFIFFCFFSKWGQKCRHGYSHQRTWTCEHPSWELHESYLGTSKWFLATIITKLEQSCSSNMNYFSEIVRNSFKWAKVATKRENSSNFGFAIQHGLLLVIIVMVPFCTILFATASQKTLFDTYKMEKHLFVTKSGELPVALLFGMPRCDYDTNMATYSITRP